MRFLSCLFAITALACSPANNDQPFLVVDPAWSPHELVSGSLPTAVFFWAPWCKKCVELLHAVDQLGRRYDGVVTVASVCLVDGREDLDELETEVEAPQSHLLWELPLEVALAQVEVANLPALLVYDSKGSLVERLPSDGFDTQVSEADLADAIDAILP